jgi:hypothetical protein
VLKVYGMDSQRRIISVSRISSLISMLVSEFMMGNELWASDTKLSSAREMGLGGYLSFAKLIIKERSKWP